jgi:hypothetical protein
MEKFAGRRILDVWYAQIGAKDVLAELDAQDRTHDLKKAKKTFKKATRKDSRQVLGKIGEMVDGRWRIIDDPPFVVPLRSADFPLIDENVRELFDEVYGGYLATVSNPIRLLMERFEVADLALKVVGVGSVGTRCFIAMLQGNGPEDILFLQLKEAGRSVLEHEFGNTEFDHAGQRVVEGQRMMQTTSDIMLGWTTADSGTEYYVRQLKDMKASAALEKMDAGEMIRYAKICGSVLANAHARSGEPAVITGYLGSNSTFANAVAGFAVRYADQNERDYAAFVQYLANGAAT